MIDILPSNPLTLTLTLTLKREHRPSCHYTIVTHQSLHLLIIEHHHSQLFRGRYRRSRSEWQVLTTSSIIVASTSAHLEIIWFTDRSAGHRFISPKALHGVCESLLDWAKSPKRRRFDTLARLPVQNNHLSTSQAAEASHNEGMDF